MEKEERRRRIISWGNDRMALITGRIQNLDQDPLPKCTSFSTLRPDPSPVQHTRSSSEPFSGQEQSLDGVAPDNITVKRHANNPGEVLNLQKDNSKSYLFGSATPQHINFSITSTEDIRAICSIVLAFLVVLSHTNMAKPKSLITYCPLCVVLLTDILIVASRLMPYIQTRHEHQMVEDEDWGDAVKLLELALVLHQTVRAIFIDCSLYVAIVVCGISLVA